MPAQSWIHPPTEYGGGTDASFRDTERLCSGRAKKRRLNGIETRRTYSVYRFHPREHNKLIYQAALSCPTARFG